MRVSFVHPKGAGQFRYLAEDLARRGADVTLITETTEAPLAGVRMLTLDGGEARPAPGPAHLSVADRSIQHAHRVATALQQLARADGAPDLVVGHIGWGGMLFVRDVLPATATLAYCEYYFHSSGGDLGFDPATPATIAELSRARLRNMVQRANLDAVDAGLSPTRWQRSRYPASLQPRIAVCHEGVDLALCGPNPDARFALPDGRVVAKGEPVVTYVSRALEPQRGFPQFMRAAARLAAQRSDVTFVVAGGDQPAYGRAPAGGGSWREAMLRETNIDPRRIVFLGTVDHATLVRLFQVSAVHVYLTVPFVLSWSMLEAMACNCLVVGSRTAPVEEAITHGRNGLLAGFFDTDDLARCIGDGLAGTETIAAMRTAARATVAERYGREACLARQVRILSDVAGRRRGGTSALG